MNSIEIISTIRLYGLMQLIGSIIFMSITIRSYLTYNYFRPKNSKTRMFKYLGSHIPVIFVTAYCTFLPTDVFENYFISELLLHLSSFSLFIYLAWVNLRYTLKNQKAQVSK